MRDRWLMGLIFSFGVLFFVNASFIALAILGKESVAPSYEQEAR